MPAPDNRPRKPNSSVSSGSMNPNGGRDPLDDIARATRQTADAITKIANASGLSVSGSSGVASRVGVGSSLTADDVRRLTTTIEDTIREASRRGSIAGLSAIAAATAPYYAHAPHPSMGGGIPPPPNPFTGLDAKWSGGGSGSGIAGTAGAFGRGGPWIAAAMATLEHTTRIGNTLQDPFATNEMKARSLAKMLPGGETILNFKDMETGRLAGMELAKYQGERDRIEARGRLETSAFMMQYRPQQAGYQALAQAYTGQSAITAGIFDRSTATGKTAYEDAQRLLPLRKETARLERDSAMASAHRLSSERELERVSRAENSLIRERVQVQRKLMEGGSGVEYQKLIERDRALAVEIEGFNQQARSAKQQVVNARREEVSVQAEHQKARVREDLIGRAENIEARAQRSEASAGRLGRMRPFERFAGLQVIKALESGVSPDQIPENQLAKAEQFDPDAFDRIIKNYGLRTPEFKERQAAGKRGFEGDYGKLYQEADTLRQEAGQKEFSVETEAAKKIKEAGSDLGAYFANQTRKFVESAKQSFDTNLKNNRNAP